MGAIAKSIGADKLPVKDKISLIDELWDDVAASNEIVEISDELAAELERRVSNYKANPETSFSAAEVRAVVQEKIGE